MSVDGVVDADVSFDEKRADVRYRPGLTEPAALVAAIDGAGFSASIMETPVQGPDRGFTQRLPAAAGLVSALFAASCCLLPLALIGTGVAGAGMMMATMRYEWLTLPLGVFGLAGAYAFYFRERRRCDTAGCRLVGERATKIILGVSTVVVGVAMLLRFLPSWTASILQNL